jgi:hypothetical protein
MQLFIHKYFYVANIKGMKDTGKNIGEYASLDVVFDNFSKDADTTRSTLRFRSSQALGYYFLEVFLCSVSNLWPSSWKVF